MKKLLIIIAAAIFVAFSNVGVSAEKPTTTKEVAIIFHEPVTLLDVGEKPPGEGCIVITNSREKNMIIQVRDDDGLWILATAVKNEKLHVIILPPGESLSVGNYDFKGTTIIKVVELDAANLPESEISRVVEWPKVGVRHGITATWKLDKDIPVKPIANP